MHLNIVDLWYFGQSTSTSKHSNVRCVRVYFFLTLCHRSMKIRVEVDDLCTNLVIFDGNVNNEKWAYIPTAATHYARHSFISTHFISQTETASATATTTEKNRVRFPFMPTCQSIELYNFFIFLLLSLSLPSSSSHLSSPTCLSLSLSNSPVAELFAVNVCFLFW